MHQHNFDPAKWPFSDPIHVTTITTINVLQGALPIKLVAHDEDGMWQILCSPTNEPKDGRVVCLGCMYEKDPSIGELADLPMGWRAWRESRSHPWKRKASPQVDDNDAT